MFPAPSGGRQLLADVSSHSRNRNGETPTTTLLDAVKESIAAGVGLVCARARFELNFALPVVKREDERARKHCSLVLG